MTKHVKRVVVEIETDGPVTEKAVVQFVDRMIGDCDENRLYEFQAMHDVKFTAYNVKGFNRVKSGLASRSNKDEKVLRRGHKYFEDKLDEILKVGESKLLRDVAKQLGISSKALTEEVEASSRYDLLVGCRTAGGYVTYAKRDYLVERYE